MRFLSLLLLLFLTGCATRRLPPYERPLRRAEFQTVRTTAYTHSEKDHRKWGVKNALGTPLRYDKIHSAAADWSRWPAGTMFRIVDTGETCVVDDYGWALAGTNTIDLYKPNKDAMRRWGVRRVRIQILRWGDPWASYRRLKPARKHKHIKRMMQQIEKRY